MTVGSTAIERLDGLHKVDIFADGPVTIAIGKPGDVKVSSVDGVSIERLSASLRVKSPAAKSGGGIVATGERSIAARSITGVVITGDNAVVSGQRVPRPRHTTGLVVEVPTGTHITVYRAASVDNQAGGVVTVEDLRE